jgi:hypothetical protein
MTCCEPDNDEPCESGDGPVADQGPDRRELREQNGHDGCGEHYRSHQGNRRGNPIRKGRRHTVDCNAFRLPSAFSL